ncbi:transcription factor HES-5-like [Salvelinus fontinalis]|uniref:transcription factor HES-5-like n=1 Tax=Salvelinus fontinalis TaxID=8038 RepID=UPI0024850653|nr:transcription factor HES-5-like [Salvelinus fontinalis]
MKPVEIRFSLHRPLQHRDPAMVPTITPARIYSKEHLTLTNKLSKPVVEKLCRDRINNSIEQLKSLLVPEILNQQPDSKLDKADILEMTVCILRQQQQNQPVSSSSCSAPVNQGYSRCVQEIVHFLSKCEQKSQSQRILLSHFQSLQPSSDKNRSEIDHPQLSSPAQHSISKEKIPVNIALWKPW